MSYEVQSIELDPENNLALAAATLIGREAYSVPSPTLPKDIVRSFNEKGQICIGAIEDNGVIGAGVMRPPSEVSSAYLSYIAVEPEMRRQGVGTAVLSELEKQAFDLGAKAMSLYALPGAIPFYQRLGYESYDPKWPQSLAKSLS